jgi:hypothetical protein
MTAERTDNAWSPEVLIEDFKAVAALAGVSLVPGDIEIERLAAPHKPPSILPPGKAAVYVFDYGGRCLKIGKVGPNSQARYVSQHYNPTSAKSTLAKSILADTEIFSGEAFDQTTVGAWIKDNTQRINFLIDIRHGIGVVTLLEAFLQCRLRPKYEGFKSQQG